MSMISYQSKRRCSKTKAKPPRTTPTISYQSKRRCSKTGYICVVARDGISYQSKRRCSKTVRKLLRVVQRSVTSQNDAAPKHTQTCGDCHRDQLPVKTTLLQNDGDGLLVPVLDQLPVKTTLLQNCQGGHGLPSFDQLPVKTTLLQNFGRSW